VSTVEWITVAVIGFFALLALLVFLRLLLRKGPPDWVEYRVGVYVERKPEKERPPPTTWEKTTAVLPPKEP